MSIPSAGRLIGKILFGYLLLSGLALNIAVLGAVYWDYYRAGKPLDLYLYDLGGRLEARSKKLAPVKNAIDTVFFRSGLLPDPRIRYARDIPYTLPRWRGDGASLLRRDTAPRYDKKGLPIALDNDTLWAVYSPPKPVRTLEVDSVEGLRAALADATPGTTIMLSPGTYRIPEGARLETTTSGTPDRPIVIRSRPGAMAALETTASNALKIGSAYLVLSDLVLRGRCSPSPCASFLAIEGGTRLILRNLFASGYTFLADIRSQPEDHFSVADGVTMIAGDIGNRIRGWRFVRNKIVPDTFSQVIEVCPPKEDSPWCRRHDLDKATGSAKPGALILLHTGAYRQAAYIRMPNLYLMAEPGARLVETATEGKGAIISDAGLTIDGLECFHIKVPDGNGACVRQQGGDLTLIGVHFHRAQMGILTGHKGGSIRILDSYIHDSGYDEDGALGHNIYVNSGELHMERTWSITARHEGHEVKSRARVTRIDDCIIASLNAADSRLVDLPDAGEVSIRNSVLEEGPLSRNWDMIGYGLETSSKTKLWYPKNQLVVTGNTVYSDKAGHSRFIHARWSEGGTVKDNVLIGHLEQRPGNTAFDDRKSAGAPPFPSLARMTP